MFDEFYGLTGKPFQLTPDPAFYFRSTTHRKALSYLGYGLAQGEGFIVVTGEVGAGKSTLVAHLMGTIDPRRLTVAQIVTSKLDESEIIHVVAQSFGLAIEGHDKASALGAIEGFLHEEAREGRRCLLIVDEAQNLTARAVEELRMLSNFQFGNQSLVQTFLVGQPEFRAILQRPEMEQFRQRIAASCHIGPLDEEDTQRYIEHRLKCAGAAGKPSFDADAFTALHRASHGIPRRINTLCDRLLLLGFMHENPHLTAADVDEVVEDLSKESASAPAPALHASELNGHASGAELAVDLDLSRLRARVGQGGMNGELGALADELAGLGLDGQDARLQRIEDSLMRLERINQQTLALLQKLVGAMR